MKHRRSKRGRLRENYEGEWTGDTGEEKGEGREGRKGDGSKGKGIRCGV